MRNALLLRSLPFLACACVAGAVTSAAPARALDAFDYAVERFQVSGAFTFTDEFDDGQRNVPPTSEFVDRGLTTVSESGGALRLRSADGAQALAFGDQGLPSSTLLRDNLSLDRPILASAVDTTVSATFRADLPPTVDGCYGVFVENRAEAEGAYVSLCREDIISFGPPLNCRVAGRPVLLLQRWDATTLACASIDPVSLPSSIVLSLKVETANKRVIGGISLDGGATFTTLNGSVPVFATADRLYPGLFGQGGSYDGVGGFATSAGLSGGATLSGVTGAAFPATLSTGTPDFASADAGLFSLSSAGGDLRLVPHAAHIDMPSGMLAATAQALRHPRRVDPNSGRPVSPSAPPGATCTVGNEPECVVDPSGPTSNRTAFDAICDLTRGFTLLDFNACSLDVFRSPTIPVPGLDLTALFGLILSGSPNGIIVVANPSFLGPASRIPVVSLSIDPGDGFASGPLATNANNVLLDFTIPGFGGSYDRHNRFQTLGRVLSKQQQALLGCGEFHNTLCDTSGAQLGGIDLFHAEAGALLQSFAPLDEAFRADDASVAQPGTAGSTIPAPCDRDSGGSVVRLPGCRAPEDAGFDAADGADPRSASLGFPAGGPGTPLLGDATLGKIGFSQGHPFTGQRWRSEMAALSWNLQMLLVAISAQVGTPGIEAKHLFDPANAYRTDGCSYVKPQLCTAVSGLLLSATRTLPGDPTGRPVVRWAWESGAQYAVDAATGRFARYAGGTLHAFGPGAISSAQPEVASYAAAVGLLPVVAEGVDSDGDFFVDAKDRCPDVFDPGQEDRDGDGVGDACDNCIEVANTNQRDTDQDGYGNICDPDLDGNGTVNFGDLALLKKVFFKTSADADFDGDGLVNFSDLARMKQRFFKAPGPSALKP